MRFLQTILLITIIIFKTNARPTTHFGQPVGDSLTLEKFIISQNIKAEKMPEGVFFTSHTEGVGATPQQGDFVKIRYVGKLLSDKIFDKSPEKEPYAYQIGKQQVIEGWDIAIQKLKVGAKVTIYVPAKLGYGSMGLGDVIAPNSPLIYEIELLDILSPAQFQAHIMSVENAEKRAFNERIEAQLLTDQKAINEYALRHKIKAKRTESGISYMITKHGKGERAKAGSVITLNYEGKFLNDSIFDSTFDRAPFSFKVDEENVILGFDEGLQQFSEGSEGYILVPSRFGYGSFPYEEGKVAIPGNSVLVFKISVLTIK
jgi:FKBP-type peptidyl-prolyl cis-trans isomerase FkpA